jgi:hypothetical protein
MSRVLKSGGQFSGCCYVSGKRSITDFFVQVIHRRKGWSWGPFYTEKEIVDMLSADFAFKKTRLCKTILLFDARKKN